MGILGLGSDEPTEVAVGFRRGWLRHVRVALTSAGSAAIIFAGMDLLHERPREGFGLLGQWGPWPIVALVGLAFFGRFMSRLNDTIQMSFSSMVESAKMGANAHGRTADALTKLVEQGGRQAEEVRRLAIYAGREFPNIYERFDQQDEVLKSLSVSLGQINARLLKANEGQGEAEKR